MKRQKPNRLWIPSAILVGFLFVVLDARFEPFATRVEGKTVRAWLNVFAANGQVQPNIVASFKASATPTLVGVIQAARRGSYIRGIIREGTGLSIRGGGIDNAVTRAAGGWLALLNAEGYALKLPNDPGLGLWLDTYDDQFYAPRFAQLALTTPQEAASLVKDIPVPELKPGQRIGIGAKLQPSKVDPTQKPWLFVKLLIAPGHHIYAMEKSLSSSVPTKVEVKFPDGVKLEGAWSPPSSEKIGGALVYRKEVVFPNRLVLSKNLAPGKYKAEIKVSFQVCNEALCWPPESLVTEVEFEVVKNAAEK